MTQETITAVANDSAVIRVILKAAGQSKSGTPMETINEAAACVAEMMKDVDIVIPVLKAIDGEAFLRKNPRYTL